MYGHSKSAIRHTESKDTLSGKSAAQSVTIIVTIPILSSLELKGEIVHFPREMAHGSGVLVNARGYELHYNSRFGNSQVGKVGLPPLKIRTHSRLRSA